MKPRKTKSIEEIDLKELTKAFWSAKRFIIKIAFIFFVFGLVIAMTSRIEYESYCKMVPEQESNAKNLGGLSGLAGLAGINLGLDNAGSIKPQLYPELTSSTPFLIELINQPVYFQKMGVSMSSLEYFKEVHKPTLIGYLAEYTIDLPSKLRTWFIGKEVLKEEQGLSNGLIRLSEEDWSIIASFRERFTLTLDQISGIVTVNVEMPDPYASAEIAKLIISNLTIIISDYKSERARLNLEFLQSRFSEAEHQYRVTQHELAQFSDRNRGITSSLYQIERQDLQNEFNVAFEIYKSLSVQLENAKIKLKEETPVFKVIEPPAIPINKSKPKRKLIIFMSTMTGVIISLFVVMIRSRRKIFI